MTAADLARVPSPSGSSRISTDYHGWKVYELPPNGQGIAALEMLNIFSLFPLADYAPRGAEELHTQIEAQKLAYADLHRYVADPRFAKVPVGGHAFPWSMRASGAKADRPRTKPTARCPPGTPPADPRRHHLSVGGGQRGQHRLR